MYSERRAFAIRFCCFLCFSIASANPGSTSTAATSSHDSRSIALTRPTDAVNASLFHLSTKFIRTVPNNLVSPSVNFRSALANTCLV
ncbi:hypothetical protein PR003_g22364 [Phytophthora rubi]|uniref:RxLR effector protein n=1 Tax=Phytophthora rubi TaxID=129364 RepID=A0A6A3J559_9STRA|nr:hypothetical protein PR001_g21674 [Phytophthora rubi]KAE8992098.1 hypothetical protein PR002_g20658 [Phytophthora rubi]KAE9302091.1 hypothetical protein PR003_g22364 [Phytophthora rubi]